MQIPADLAAGKYHLVVELLPYRPATVATRGTADPNVSFSAGVYTVQQPLLGGSVNPELRRQEPGRRAGRPCLRHGGERRPGRGQREVDRDLLRVNHRHPGGGPIGSASGKNVDLWPGESQTIAAPVALPVSLAGGPYRVIAAITGGGGLANANTVNGVLKGGAVFRVGAGQAKKGAA